MRTRRRPCAYACAFVDLVLTGQSCAGYVAGVLSVCACAMFMLMLMS